MHWLLYPWRKSPQYQVDRKLGGPQSWSGCGDKGKNYMYKEILDANLAMLGTAMPASAGAGLNLDDKGQNWP
jgi:hypothetical protein